MSYRISITKNGQEVGSLGPYARLSDANADARATQARMPGAACRVAPMRRKGAKSNPRRNGKSPKDVPAGYAVGQHPLSGVDESGFYAISPRGFVGKGGKDASPNGQRRYRNPKAAAREFHEYHGKATHHGYKGHITQGPETVFATVWTLGDGVWRWTADFDAKAGTLARSKGQASGLYNAYEAMVTSVRGEARARGADGVLFSPGERKHNPSMVVPTPTRLSNGNAHARKHAAADRRNPQRIPAGMTVEWLPANQAWIVLALGGSPSNLGTGRGNYYPTKTELKRDLATLGLRLAGNRIVGAENRTNPTVDVSSLSEAEFVKKTKIGKRYSTQSGRRFARVSDKAGLFTTDVIVREREDAPEEKDATKIKLRAYAQLRVGSKGHAKANPRRKKRRNFIPLVAAAAPAVVTTVARILPYLIQAREVACTSGGRMAIQKALDTVCIGKTGQTTAPVAAPGIKTNPLVKYRGHVVIGTRGLYTVAPYNQTFSSLAEAKRWLDGHVARERSEK